MNPPSKRKRSDTADISEEVLPVELHKEKLLQVIRDNQIVVVCGETGSGKTTLLPKFLLDSNFVSPSRKLCVTQPRRVAALSVASRVAELLNTKLGDAVGYSVRFDEKLSSSTAVKFMTDGKLLHECLSNPTLEGYGIVMIDEAHERSLNTDVLFGLLKQLVLYRKDIKVIISSATLDADKFSAYFRGCPVFKVEGRLHDVKIFYTKQEQSDICEAAVQSVLQIHHSQPKGDILVFMPGVDEISRTESSLKECDQDLEIVTLHGQKTLDEQQLIFRPSSDRKVVLATNIAETSITVPNIVHVVDSGMVKEKHFESLNLVRCSQASAKQRAGRAGRLNPGICFRLYTSSIFETMPAFSKPEIMRTNLQTVLLLLLSMEIDIFHFEMIDSWSSDSFYSSLKCLYALGAVNKDAELTKLGRVLVEFPTSPEVAKLMVVAMETKFLEQATIVAATVPEFSRISKHFKKAFSAGSNPEGDWGELISSFLYIKKSLKAGSSSSNRNYNKHLNSFKGVVQTQDQLVQLCSRLSKTICTTSFNYNPTTFEDCAKLSFPLKTADRNNDGTYTLKQDGSKALIHPSSVLANRAPRKIVYCDLLYTSKQFLLCCMPLS